MPYELFDSKALRIGSPALTIGARGRVSLNADVGDILTALGAKYAQVLWDSENFRMAVRPLAKRDPKAFKLTFYPDKRRGAVFSLQSFLKHIHWQQKSKSFTVRAAWNEKDGLLEVSLPRDRVGATAGESPRKGR
jgi:hypothetical protein